MIENEYLRITIKEKGAELASVYNKTKSFDYLWSGDDRYWSRHAPVLFPIIGKLNQDAYTVENQQYTMSQHGFARDFDFEVIHQNEQSVLFRLTDNEQTRNLYPFHFSLDIHYLLEGKTLSVNYSVKNLNEDKQMPFSLSAHPGFNVPLNNEGSFSDYQLNFTPTLTDPVQILEIDDGPFPYITGEKKEFPMIKDSTLNLTYDTFDNGLLILNEAINTVTLSSRLSENSISLDVREFPYLTLWTGENKQASFLCIEPFYGLPDQIGEIGDLHQKKGSCILDPSASKNLSFSMSFN
ncbi:aldose 1-epimerase family protein [Carnobacterium mobile]|uniref:aldose 1-epimerase family protein n=1 Tax=Carnobacterium mobile TaxID=2750 RepID=UPI001867AECA|nr:aldose 1-epimerase family protein [Carnobacterium mobile]